MNCSDMTTMVHRYFDGDLAKAEEAPLFFHLSACDACREEFKLLGAVKAEFHAAQADVPAAFERRLFSAIGGRGTSAVADRVRKGIPAYVFYAAACVVVIVSFIVFREMSDMKSALSEKVERIELQQAQINSLIGSMPAVKVRAAIQDPDLVRTTIQTGGAL